MTTADAPVYLDHAATTPLAPEVLAVMLPLLEHGWGNPSSAHAVGRTARSALDGARERIAQALGCRPAELVLTSGGSEADNLALRGVIARRGGGNLVVSAIEHDAVLRTAEMLTSDGRATLTVVPCDGRGMVDPERVAAAVTGETVLVSVMLVNNEVGTVQDVTAIAAAARARNPSLLIHTDAVQALGRLPLGLDALDVDLLTVTAHKVYGPKGIGALAVRRGAGLAPQVTGGGQERARRAGTENTAAAAGFAAAVDLVTGERVAEWSRMEMLGDRLRRFILDALPDLIDAGAGAPRLPSFVTVAVPGVATEVLLTRLDGVGIAASGGSACSSGAAMPSHVLAAMGLPPRIAAGALRLTLGRGTTEAEIARAGQAVVEAVRAVRAAPTVVRSA